MPAKHTVVESRLSELKGKSYAELSQLAKYQGEKMKAEGRSVTLAIWKDVLSDREVRIVVQAYRHLFLGIGTMEARGFRIDADEKISELAKDEIYEFI